MFLFFPETHFIGVPNPDSGVGHSVTSKLIDMTLNTQTTNNREDADVQHVTFRDKGAGSVEKQVVSKGGVNHASLSVHSRGLFSRCHCTA